MPLTLVRRMVLILVIVFFSADEDIRLLCAVLCLNIFFVLIHLYFKPYINPKDNNLEVGSLISLIILAMVLGCNTMPYRDAVQITSSLIAFLTAVTMMLYILQIVKARKKAKMVKKTHTTFAPSPIGSPQPVA